MRAFLYSIIFILIPATVFAQQSERLTDWTIAGLRNFTELPEITIDFISSGGIGDGITDNTNVIQDIFSQLPASGGIINIGEGVFRFVSPIEVPSNTILKGVSAIQTILEFELDQEDHLIKVVGDGLDPEIFFLNNLSKDCVVLDILGESSLTEGVYVIIQDNDSLNITSSWATNSTGQILKLGSESDKGFNIESPLRRNYNIEDKPQGQIVSLKSNVGIESLRIRNLKETSGQTSNIYFRNVRDSWVKCVKSESSNYAHVEVIRSTNMEISGSHFKDGFQYTGGGKAYGVMLHFTTGEVLVINNQFEHLRHSMILQAGANGNVIAYNYSKDPFWIEAGFPENSAGDLVLHGNYVYANLFESNVVQNIVIDASHGINGKYNTFLRNRAELYGIVMDPIVTSNGQNFIGNEITSNITGTGFYAIFGTNHYEEANNRIGTYIPELKGDENIAASLFITGQPAYYNSNNWPPIGFGTTINENKIQSQEGHNNDLLTDCEEVELTTSLVSMDEHNEYSIYPNPVIDWLYFHYAKSAPEVSTVILYDPIGRVVYYRNDLEPINTSNLASGIYTLKIYSAKSKPIAKRVVIQNR